MIVTTVATSAPTVVLIGRESVGKTQLAAALTGSNSSSANFRGSTVSIDRYRGHGWEIVDTPGILRSSDTETTRLTLQVLAAHDLIVLVVQATCLDQDLEEMLPLVVGKRGAVVLTFWDRVQQGEAALEAIERLERECGVPFLAVNTARIGEGTRQQLQQAVANPGQFTRSQLTTQAGWRIEPQPGVLEHRLWGPVISVLLLFLPALVTIFGANRFADWLHPLVAQVVNPWIAQVQIHAPAWLRIILVGQHQEFGYGLLNMGPFLFVWALPTVLLFSLIIAVYKTTGLIERINAALHPLVRPFGLSGRDLIRVVMGFGCNVPAVISTRACSSCSRATAVAAISFGAACSYQLPATLAVLSVGAHSSGESPFLLVFGFLGYLLLTTLIYLRLTAPRLARSRANLMLHFQRPFLQWPTIRGLWLEVRSTLQQFFTQAIPVFLLICMVASLAAEWGLIDTLSGWLGPVMSLFNLPSEAAISLVMASLRKDGIYLLISDDNLITPMSGLQVLTAVYLAGVLLPCLVTALQIKKELGWKPAVKIVARQAMFAVLFAIALGQSQWLFQSR